MGNIFRKHRKTRLGSDVHERLLWSWREYPNYTFPKNAFKTHFQHFLITLCTGLATKIDPNPPVNNTKITPKLRCPPPKTISPLKIKLTTKRPLEVEAEEIDHNYDTEFDNGLSCNQDNNSIPASKKLLRKPSQSTESITHNLTPLLNSYLSTENNFLHAIDLTVFKRSL